ncbi:hypothetical protein [Clostridium butyricum]|uniref:hypothetical protein n=1 Tax=Clostridium butyricum TaxID=1492 RepID=UPI0013D8A814|nr:hypothetical protein [Clostridium butyricum]MCQ2017462.1 hypothetical protein [Clostridium butyricum]MCQ2023186.1 hypothetical protein [Clostridium butyricum]NFB71965.1 hypothetical protein [Clostridium butyricum]UTY53330.1 hypothetical protein HNS01_09620 [Clostridium butyricum]
MGGMDDINLLAKSNKSHSGLKSFGENLIKAATGDVFAAKDIIKLIVSSPMLIRDFLFWEKFELFLKGVFLDNDDARKLSEIFADKEEKVEYSKRIIKIIDDLETDNKVESMIHLTRALLLKLIEKTEYYRLCNALRNTLQEDLKFLNENIEKTILKENIHIEFLLQNGLVRQTVIDGNGDNEFEFTPLAHMLDKYGLDYGSESKKYKYSSDKFDKLAN